MLKAIAAAGLATIGTHALLTPLGRKVIRNTAAYMSRY